MTTILTDVRYALRQIAQQKVFAATALLTLALCIGANAAIFGVVNSVLLKPLPFDGAERLVRVHNNYPGAGVERVGASAPDYYERRELVPAFEQVAMVTSVGLTIGEAGRPERIAAAAATPSLFEMLGVVPQLGRTFTVEEGEHGNHRVVMLTWGYWQERLAGAGNVIGSTMRINEAEYEVVGVLPRGFMFEERDARLWVPQTFTEGQRSDNGRHSNNWEMVAKLRPGATVAQAQQQIDALNVQLDERLPQLAPLLRSVGFHTSVHDYRSDLVQEIAGTLWLLQAGVVFILLIGSVNIANLVLVRTLSRRRELATRAALGAGRTQLARQMVTESLVLALLGGLLGVILAGFAIAAIETFAADRLPAGTSASLDGATLVAAFVVAALAGLLVAAMPVFRLMRQDLVSAIRDGGRASTAGGATQRGRAALVVVQVTLAFVLLSVSGLLLTSYARTLDIPTGFDPEGVVTAALPLSVTRHPDADAWRRFGEAIVERVEALPGVQSAAVSTMAPFTGGLAANALYAEGSSPGNGDSLLAPAQNNVTPGYFDAMGIRLVAGRTFTDQDRADVPLVAVVDRELAGRLWPGQDPIGRRFSFGAPGMADPEFRTVVGVVENVRLFNLTGDQPPGHAYVPFAQFPFVQQYLVVRAQVSADALIPALRAAIAEIDPELPLYDAWPLTERVANSLATERLRTLLVAAFGAVALLLAAVGLYGVLSYAVAERRAEIGIRMALGSTAGAVFALVLRGGLTLTAIGFALGAVVSIAVGGALRHMLHGISAVEVGVLAGVAVVLAAAAFAACALPARTAMRTAPVIAMRGDA